MQNGRHFWTCVWSSHLKSVNNHRDRHVPGRETQNSRSLLDLRVVVASPKCQESEGSALPERGENREERRGERRQEKEGEERGDSRGERRQKKEGEERGERREEREERREEIG